MISNQHISYKKEIPPIELSDRIRALMDHYGLNTSQLAELIGGSKVKFYNLLNGSSKPDFKTTEAFLQKFPDVSAEWLMRGQGLMIKGETVSIAEMEELRQRYEIMKSLYKEAIISASRL